MNGIARHLGSFKLRLVAFFLLLSLLPLTAALWAFSEVAKESETARADSRVSAALRSAAADYGDELTDAQGTATALAHTTGFMQMLSGQSQVALSNLYEEQEHAAFFRNGVRVAGSAPPDMAARREAIVASTTGTRLGRVVVFVPLDAALVSLLRKRSGLEEGDRLVLSRGERVVAGARAGASLPVLDGPATVTFVDGKYRAWGAEVDEDLGLRLSVLVPNAKIEAAAADLRRRLLLFSIIALSLVALLAYALGRNIVRSLRELADAAAAVSRGNFSSRVPVRGRDEFARLGHAFNEMAGQLETRVDELAWERGRARDALTRFGEALAATNDPLQLLPVIVESIVEATGASGGRLLVAGEELARAGRPDARRQPLQIALGDDTPESGGLLLLTPKGGDFSDESRELAYWLASQAWTALENARLHGRLQQEVVTDGLTELPNRRGFQRALETELRRAERLGGDLGLIVADLDGFKSVNDRHGHLAGDDVLVAFADVMRDTVREIDVAARYGGEEFAVLLPGTDVEGAELVAERLRARMEHRAIRGHAGQLFSVTASFGVASFPEVGEEDLFGAADQALYSAKNAGKNCVAVAGERAIVRPEP